MNTIIHSLSNCTGVRIKSLCCCAVPIVLSLAVFARAQDAANENEGAAKRLAVMKQSVSQVEFARADGPGTKLSIHPEPIQRWNNLVSGVNDGTVFVWTLNGRPEVAAQVFQIRDGRWLQEFQSLSRHQLTGTHGGRRFWSPTTAGVEMKPLTDAAGRPSSKTANGRRAQMRAIGRQFKATDVFENREPYDLRFLPQPLYEYDDLESHVIHGALFAFVHGTDPEVLLLIEAKKSNEGLVWEIGFAPLTSYECRVARDGDRYWSCPKRPPPNQPTDTFFLHVYQTVESE